MFLGVVLESVAVVFLWSGGWVEAFVFLSLGNVVESAAAVVQDRFAVVVTIRGMMMMVIMIEWKEMNEQWLQKEMEDDGLDWIR
jgi:hypothetical protein